MKQGVLKAKIKERYGKIALSGNSDCCCTPQECCNTTEFNPKSSSVGIGYDNKALDSIPESSILGVGCGAPLNFANLKTGEIVVDLGSGAGIDAFLASKLVKGEGKVIGIDIEDNIPVENNSVDAVISNCVINLTTDKVKTFKEIYRILKKDGLGRMIISDLVTSKEVHGETINSDDWCSCIDGALTKDNYINCIKQAGFQDVKVLNEHTYLSEDKTDGRKITSIIVGAITK